MASTASASASPARSPSPSPARPCGAMRRSSVDSSAFKPSSPSRYDSPHRGSASKNGGGGCQLSPRPSCLGKENHQRDPTSAAKSAAAALAKGRSGGGAKSFMAPTISAASKAVAAAALPRKKVLGERNDLPFRSPPPDPPQQAEETPEPLVATTPWCLRVPFEEEAPTAAAVASPVTAHSSWRSPSPAATPVDAAVEQLPYDPVTNYLAPRPQFLYYKPNPRLERYRHGAGGLIGLDDNSSSESSNGTTSEEVVTEQDSSEEEDEKESALSGAEADADIAAEPYEEEELAPSEAEANGVTLAEACVPAPEPRVKRRSCARLLLAPLALLLLMAAALVGVPLLHPPVMSHSSVSKASLAFLSVQELRPVDLAAGLRHWSSNCFASVAFYLAAFGSPPGQELGPHFSANLSAADAGLADGFCYSIAETMPGQEAPVAHSGLDQEFIEDSGLDQEFIEDSGHEAVQSDGEISAGHSEVIDEPEAAARAEVDVVVEEGTAELDEVMVGACSEEEKLNDQMADEEVTAKVDAESEEEIVELEVIRTNGVEEKLNDEMAEEESPSSYGEEIVFSRHNSEASPMPAAVEPEEVEDLGSIEHSSQQDAQIDEPEGDRFDDKEGQQKAYPGLESEEEMTPGWYWGEDLTPAAVTALAAAVVAAVMAFLYTKKKQARVGEKASAPAEQIEARSSWGSSEGHLLVKCSQFQRPAVDDSERINNPGASQYSSSSMSSGHRRQKQARVAEYGSAPAEQAEQMETQSGSGSSEGDLLMKCSQYSSSSVSPGHRGRARKAKGEEESILSLEQRSRRESLAHSSSSYGSFTTYEKISSKKGSREEEEMTPVRRSSRLRNHITSP